MYLEAIQLAAIRLLSWNVNGLRAVYRKGFLEWLKRDRPDILALQETKVAPGRVPAELQNIEGYLTYFGSGQRSGRDGVALFSRVRPEGPRPLSVKYSLEIEGFDDEKRAIVADYGDFLLFNVYFPNGKASKEKLAYKLEFYDLFLEHIIRLQSQGRSIVICGDVNTAHKEIDLARPKANEKISGFLPEERAWMDRLVESGFADTFRIFHKEGGNYSWWDLKTKARERNVGWRIDYFFVSRDLSERVRSAFILKDVAGADHCPVGIELEI
ncbi:MAG TPA: exodeoxyribonuclease III [Methanothrix sp.]|mgnify:FL=1|nr:exodeoxyribonuclease III [Methanothrix sp.]